jgi:predicted flap endonuclease-1-like 5' DNA nuclease
LEENGVDEVEDFLGLSNKELKDIAEKTDISLKLLDKWQEHADLMRIKGVGPEYADLLNQIGIDSVKEFAQRNPENTLERVEELDKKKPDVIRRLPLLDEIKDWIAQAKKL